ncbi:DNA phosphorothioation-dependent restriction protein DptH [Sphingobacterium phlebotomi]|uniref:DNA phosphorothioation-dependent restriction protein DptH n=1 Tax=Sphingobacterium phlebotomi TaxID=2605433 RepID=A0A5D4H628_9SPHI|nr:DNA phosphorothioation-dependent restriction protein DptH [Sphingobacterium phlebotomi]TYR36158.1 DNA phosphorothioation-dependent restriction protein DptH [Sphingobacterium phlebotomi]
MHSTLNPLYKYISQLIVEFLTIQEIQPGERYNLYMEEKSNVRQLYEALRKEDPLRTHQFAYKHPEGSDTFESFTIQIGQTKVLVASSENATEDYFTMLRNCISDQSAGFENTALFILYSQKLESISGGSGNLEKDGMPLHYLSFRDRVSRDIDESSSLETHEKEILKSVLKFKTKSVLEDNNSIFDYESVVSILSKGRIDTEDFRKLGLFPHEELASKGNKIEEDIQRNYNLFGEIESIFLNGDPEIELKERLPDNQYSKFVKGDWKNTDYTDISKWLEFEKNKVAPEIVSVSCNTDDVTLWKRTDGSTTAKKRQYNCILFNPEQRENISLEIKFDQRTKNQGIAYRGKALNVQTSGFNLIITFLGSDNDTSPFHLVEYKDPDSGKKYTFRLLHVHFESYYLAQFETIFLLKSSTTEPALSVQDDNTLVFNEGAQTLTEDQLEYGKNYNISEEVGLKLFCDYYNIPEEEIYFNITIEDTEIPIHIKPDFEPPRPITGLDVWKEKRINKSDFRYKQEEEVIKIQLKIDQQERTVSGDFRKNLVIEDLITKSDAYSWIENSNGSISELPLDLPQNIQHAFDEFRAIFRKKKAQPSLAYLTDAEQKIAAYYVQNVLEYISNFDESQPLTVEQKNVFQLGVLRESSGTKRIKLSPYHPLNVAYQLQVNEVLDHDTKCYNATLKRLTPSNLLPYIQGKSKEIYIPAESAHSPEWTYYSIYSDTKQGIAKSYISDLIATKLKDFKNNYSILFDQSTQSPVRINIINQGDCKEVLHGIFEFYRTELNYNKDKRLMDLIPIEVFIYGSENLVNKFEELAFYTSINEIEEQLGINLKTNAFDKEDLLNAFFDKVKFYSRAFPKDNNNFEYAHITFYQFDTQQSNFSFNNISDVKTGLSLRGLLSDVSFVAHQNTYRTGFGTKFLPKQMNTLTDLAMRYNSFAKVASNDDPYDSSKALCTTISYTLRTELERLYANSHWVTYIDPRVDLDFFKDNTDLVIVHYSDQYTNSSGYDAITVSRKTEQYAFVVREFLSRHNVAYNASTDTIPIINFFNAINGDWLLGLVRQRSHFPKEKLSLLSGVKTALAFLYTPDIIWVPISLEEILRVSGNVGLTKEEGLFSTKNLGGIGSYSDDLLMIGLEMNNNELSMHFYPVELKAGGSNIVKKGKIQGAKTAELIFEHLSEDGFVAEFYKNFFAKLVLTSVEKMKLFQIWESQDWDTITNDYRAQLLNNEFTISNSLSPFIGDFGLIYFGKGAITRTLKVLDNCMEITLLEQDGYDFLVKSVDHLIDLFHHSKTTIDTSRLLASTYNIDNIANQDSDVIKRVQADEPSTTNNTTAPNSYLIKTEKIAHATGMKILFGTDLNKQTPVIWEPNNTDKVMHTNTGIIGTMGTGKTQFTKSLIAQMQKNADQNPGNERLGILIFDYKGDYVKDDFVIPTNAKVYEPHQLPYNPLALDATARSKPMLPLHTANDIKETIANAFNLGNVQKQKLRDIIVAAYESKGIERAKRDTWSKPSPTLGDVCDIYLDDPNIAHDSLYAAISNLSDFEIFESDPAKTQSLYSLIDGVVVINLSGYDESIQNLIVAITLDAFYTQMQRHGHSSIEGNLRQLRKIILVDEADNFLGKNFQSLKKILKEGREFGVGTVLSTQFLNHFATGENEYSNYILTWVIHRVNEIKMKEIESLFALDNRIQKENLLKTIKSLEKHQSVVNLAGSEPLVIRDKAFWEL